MSIRDLRNRARGHLHTAMSIPAIYVDPDGQTVTACSIRVHHKQRAFGDMTGFDYQPAEVLSVVPEVVMLASEVSTPKRGGVFSIAADEAYHIEVPEPRDGITITAQCTRMSAAEIAAGAYPLPGA